MRRVVSLVTFLMLLVASDIYSYIGIRTIFKESRFKKLIKYSYIFFSVLTYLATILLMFYFMRTEAVNRTPIINLTIGFLITVFVTKLIFGLLTFIQDGGRLLTGIFTTTVHLFQGKKGVSSGTFIPERRKFLSQASILLASVPFSGMLYGITKGKYRFTKEHITLTFDDLPPAFDGFRIVQISDIHSGSFDSMDKVLPGVNMVNDLNPDIVCFTGDLVNSNKDEVNPYIDLFAKIKAKYGKFAIFGNHDYYGIYDPYVKEDKETYYADFFSKYKRMGFDLISNDMRVIEKDGESINLVGVENWSAADWFPKKGDIDKASARVKDGDFNVLMSHDPTHWDEIIIDYQKKMHLTMSGHTHGAQFGFNIPGMKWSPAKYFYKHWAGLYHENDRYLYVNRGFGFLGWPGRLGMWPEVTLIELKRG